MKRYESIINGFHPFNESVVDVQRYLKLLNNIFNVNENKIKKSKENIFSLQRVLNKIFKSYFIKFVITKKDEIQKHRDYRYGLIVAETLFNKHSIIRIYCNKNILDIINNDNIYNEFKKRCIRYIQHELIHRLQTIEITDLKIKTRLASDNSDKFAYFSNKLEIMAFAWMIIEELRFSGFTDSQIKNKLKNLKITSNESNLLFIYLKLFEKDSDQLKGLYKYIYMYLEGQFSDKELNNNLR